MRIKALLTLLLNTHWVNLGSRTGWISKFIQSALLDVSCGHEIAEDPIPRLTAKSAQEAHACATTQRTNLEDKFSSKGWSMVQRSGANRCTEKLHLGNKSSSPAALWNKPRSPRYKQAAVSFVSSPILWHLRTISVPQKGHNSRRAVSPNLSRVNIWMTHVTLRRLGDKKGGIYFMVSYDRFRIRLLQEQWRCVFVTPGSNSKTPGRNSLRWRG